MYKNIKSIFPWEEDVYNCDGNAKFREKMKEFGLSRLEWLNFHICDI